MKILETLQKYKKIVFDGKTQVDFNGNWPVDHPENPGRLGQFSTDIGFFSQWRHWMRPIHSFNRGSGSGANFIKLFFCVTDAAVKEDRLCAQGKFFRLVKHLRVRPRAYTWILCGGSRITRKYLTCAKNVPGAKSLYYFAAASVTKKKGWLILVPCSGFFKDPPNPVDPGSIAGVGLVFILLKPFSLSL